MNGTKMSKAFFFLMIEKRLNELTKEVEELKAKEDMPIEERISRENILFGRLCELNAINSSAMDVDYWKYSELDAKIKVLRDKI